LCPIGSNLAPWMEANGGALPCRPCHSGNQLRSRQWINASLPGTRCFAGAYAYKPQQTGPLKYNAF
jgi:hypothetical protein